MYLVTSKLTGDAVKYYLSNLRTRVSKFFHQMFGCKKIIEEDEHSKV